MHAHDATDAARGPIAAQNIWVAMERANSPAAANPFVNADWKAGITVLIGPEGGFSDAEKQLFNGLGLTTFSLGKRILRMETAAVLSLGLASVLDA
jgi:16S rRNA (uracil1498-N3)-methyltransferase